MTTQQGKQWFTVKNVLAVLLGALFVYLLVQNVIAHRFAEIELNTRVMIADQTTVLAAIAEATARNGADQTTESIIRDCTLSERASFDDLLARLNDGLSRAQLVELERLFGRCGSFYSDRKAVMVARLSREIEVYEDYVYQLGVVIGEDLSSPFQVERWKSLAAEEQRQSVLFSELVKLQDKIISTLLTGKTPDSPEITEILQEANQTQESLIVANKQASNLRSTLLSL